ncbi:flagellar basal body P-ring formation chaperone FlgA [Marinobacter sp. SS21]|uniref:flagellar basal body P-ring formation chaperone FlgA n=1 Tax=Marinobacter sp. SS21 TaxID=2979460 RepID=UPI00232E6532|nr:flagellar basal body P-ring formation chaperone FlgA [Marinobacter sp. SS21]MDC0663351.1 flagellar basal body P-ring formation chaperone FlgA [Marinobacter sp. SS21]
MRIFILATLLLAVTEPTAAESGDATPQQIRTAATAFLQTFADAQAEAGYQVGFDVGQLDPRLNLAACATTPKVAFSGDPWQTTQPTLLVQCEGQRPWRMYLPSKVTISGLVFTASRPVARGERISRALVTSATSVVNGSRRAPITNLEQLLGKEASRSLNQGAVYTPAVVEEPDTVQRGDHVIITARSGNFSVQSRGKALASGQTGEQVMVENLSSARRVQGLIVGPGRIEIPM